MSSNTNNQNGQSNNTFVIIGAVVVILFFLGGIRVEPEIQLEIGGVNYDVEIPEEGEKYVYSDTKTFSISYITYDEEYDVVGFQLTYLDSAPIFDIVIGVWSEPYQINQLMWMASPWEEFRRGEMLFMTTYLPLKHHNSLNYVNVTYSYTENGKTITEGQQMWFEIPT